MPFKMYEMEYKEGGFPQKDKYDFTTFLDKLAYELKFNDKFKKSSGFTKRSINEVDNSNSGTKKKRKKQEAKDDDDDDDDDDGDDEGDCIHRLMTFADKFPTEAGKLKQTKRLKCQVCENNGHKTIIHTSVWIVVKSTSWM